MISVMKVMVIISFPDWSVTNWPCLLHSSFSSPLSPLRLLILWKVISIDALISTMTINWLLSAPLSSAPWWLPKYPHRGGGLHEPRGVPGHKQRMLFWRRPRQPQKRNRGETAPTPMLLIWYNKKENINKYQCYHVITDPHMLSCQDYEYARPNRRVGKCVCKPGFVQVGTNFACERKSELVFNQNASKSRM